jgi:hypothetical protein
MAGTAFPIRNRFATINNLGIVGNAIGDYSTPTDFSVGPPEGEVWEMHRVIGYIEDAGTFSGSGYGALSALTNGIRVRCYRGSTMENDLLNGEAIKTNTQWKAVCFDIKISEFGLGNANESLGFRWTWAKSGTPITLNGDLDDQIRFTMQDNLTGLINHSFLVQGFLILQDYQKEEK